MSTENHPNIHAVNTALEIAKIIHQNLRGIAAMEAAHHGPTFVYEHLRDELVNFIEKISTKLDNINYSR